MSATAAAEAMSTTPTVPAAIPTILLLALNKLMLHLPLLLLLALQLLFLLPRLLDWWVGEDTEKTYQKMFGLIFSTSGKVTGVFYVPAKHANQLVCSVAP